MTYPAVRRGAGGSLLLTQLALDLLATVADRFHRRLDLGLAGSGLPSLVLHLMVLPASDLCAILAAPASFLSGGHFFLQSSIPVPTTRPDSSGSIHQHPVWN